MIRKITFATAFIICVYALFLISAHQEEPLKMPEHIKPFTHVIENQKIYGITAGKICNLAVLFIHGAPGDWKSWGRYLNDKDLLDKIFMIAVDRPGYAGSGKGKAITDIKQQTAYIAKAVLKEHKGPFLLVGHSFGGPLQVQFSADYSDIVAKQIILAGAIDPKLHHKRFYHRLGNLFFIRPFLPTPLRVTNDEMLALQSELKKQEPLLSNIKTPTTVIQGEDDWLVPSGNADYAKKSFMNVKNMKIIRLKQQGHFLPWEQYDLVKRSILNLVEETDQCEA